MTTDYLRWVINAALETTSLILWWQGSVTQVQPVLFPDTPFRWLDDDPTTLYDAPEDDRRTGRGDVIH